MSLEFFWWAFLGFLIVNHLSSPITTQKRGYDKNQWLGSSLFKLFLVSIPITVLVCLFLAYNVPW